MKRQEAYVYENLHEEIDPQRCIPVHHMDILTNHIDILSDHTSMYTLTTDNTYPRRILFRKDKDIGKVGLVDVTECELQAPKKGTP